MQFFDYHAYWHVQNGTPWYENEPLPQEYEVPLENLENFLRTADLEQLQQDVKESIWHIEDISEALTSLRECYFSKEAEIDKTLRTIINCLPILLNYDQDGLVKKEFNHWLEKYSEADLPIDRQSYTDDQGAIKSIAAGLNGLHRMKRGGGPAELYEVEICYEALIEVSKWFGPNGVISH
ncbi:MAG: hypothetical protein V7731_18225 [Amphritea sp.]